MSAAKLNPPRFLATCCRPQRYGKPAGLPSPGLDAEFQKHSKHDQIGLYRKCSTVEHAICGTLHYDVRMKVGGAASSIQGHW